MMTIGKVTRSPEGTAVAAVILFFVLLSCAGCGGEEPLPAAGGNHAPSAQAAGPETLREQLEDFAGRWGRAASAEVIEVVESGIETLKESAAEQRALQVGDRAADFTLVDADGGSVSLGEELQKGPVVLSWYLGGWCPYCGLELEAYQASLERIEALGASVMGISPQSQSISAELAGQLGLEFDLLIDQGNLVAQEYGLSYRPLDEFQALVRQWAGRPDYNGDDNPDLPIPATYVVDTDGVIRYSFVDSDYRKRAEPAEVIRVLEELAK